MITRIRALAAVVALCAATTLSGADAAEIWTFDRIDRIGGHVTTVLGHPVVIGSPVGKAKRRRYNPGHSECFARLAGR